MRYKKFRREKNSIFFYFVPRVFGCDDSCDGRAAAILLQRRVVGIQPRKLNAAQLMVN